MLVNKFIIALCPATPIYLTKQDVPSNRVLSLRASTIVVETSCNKAEALVFDTFEAAMEVCKDIKGWGGAQRVEGIIVQVPDTRVTLDTPEARIEVRDNATAQYNAAIEAGYAERNAAEEVAKELRSLGIQVGVDFRDGASCTVSLYLADHLGNLLDLNWDPMQDGFAYETEGDDACDIGETDAQHEAEPCPDADPDCECCGGTGVRVTNHFGNSLHGGSTSDCECTWRDSTEDDDGTPCDGCGATDAEPCGDSEGFAFCAACRAKDSDAAFTPHDVDADAEEVEDLPLYADTASPSVFVSPEEIAAAVRRTDCATVTLTDAQRERAAVLLTDALRDLIDFHLPRLIGNAQLDAAEGA